MSAQAARLHVTAGTRHRARCSGSRRAGKRPGVQEESTYLGKSASWMEMPNSLSLHWDQHDWGSNPAHTVSGSETNQLPEAGWP